MVRITDSEKKKIEEEVKVARSNEKSKQEIEKKAFELIAGNFGAEEIDAKEALAAEGFSYDEVSAVAHAILSGTYYK